MHGLSLQQHRDSDALLFADILQSCWTTWKTMTFFLVTDSKYISECWVAAIWACGLGKPLFQRITSTLKKSTSPDFDPLQEVSGDARSSSPTY